MKLFKVYPSETGYDLYEMVLVAAENASEAINICLNENPYDTYGNNDGIFWSFENTQLPLKAQEIDLSKKGAILSILN